MKLNGGRNHTSYPVSVCFGIPRVERKFQQIPKQTKRIERRKKGLPAREAKLDALKIDICWSVVMISAAASERVVANRPAGT